MAHRLGISRSYYNALERGRRQPGKWLQKTLQTIRDELQHNGLTNVSKVHSLDHVKSLESPHAAGRDDILDYLKPWFDRIERDPNVAPFILTQLRKHLPIDDLNLFRS
jgi:transcriptional regulator with XRE-family HTH domain